MENTKLIIIAKKLSLSIKTDLVYEISNTLQQNKGTFLPMVSVLSAIDFVKLVYLVSLIKQGETNFEAILWRIENEGFTFALGSVLDDKVRETCGSCGGNGQIDCSVCDNGELECDSCYGSGEDEEGDTCGDCDGSGNLECDYCDGSGYEPCDDCDGDGDIVQSDTYEVSIEYFFSINEELKTELLSLQVYDEIESDDIAEYRKTNQTFILNNEIKVIYTDIELSDSYESYFIGIDEDGDVYGKGSRPSTNLH